MSGASEPPRQIGTRNALGVERLGTEQIANRLAGLGDDLHRKIAPLLAEIRQLEGSQPWGATDRAGKEFLKDLYHLQVDGGQLNEVLKKILENAGSALTNIGGAGAVAMKTYGDADELPPVDKLA